MGTSDRDSGSPHWSRAIRRRLVVTDAIAVVVSLAIAQLMRYGLGWFEPRPEHTLAGTTTVSAVIAVAWIAGLALNGSRDRRILGIGSL